MTVLRLDPTWYLVWAERHRADKIYEVSREIRGPLQAKCKTSPYCPDELLPDQDGLAEDQLRINPDFIRPIDCPYGFGDKDSCYRDINTRALRAGLFGRKEVVLVGNFLIALGYRVHTEPVRESAIDGRRILLAHLGDERDSWGEFGPKGVTLRFTSASPTDLRGEPFPWE